MFKRLNAYRPANIEVKNGVYRTADIVPRRIKSNLARNCRYIARNWELYLFLLPSAVILFCFTYIPMYGVQMAFQDFDPVLGVLKSPWVGLDNFTTFFKSYQFKTVIFNTVGVSLYTLLVTFPFPIILALILNQVGSKWFRQTVQVVTYLPHFISMVVMVGLVLIWLSPSIGLFGNACRLLGVAKPPNILGNSSLFSSIYVWTDVWQHTGWDSIIYLAALSAIPTSLYEAAKVDGGSKWQRLIYIDVPSLLPTATILLIMRIGSIMNLGFEKVYLLQNPMNLSTSEVIVTYVYKIGILHTQYAVSAAVALFNNVINFLLLITVNGICRRISDTSLW